LDLTVLEILPDLGIFDNGEGADAGATVMKAVELTKM